MTGSRAPARRRIFDKGPIVETSVHVDPATLKLNDLPVSLEVLHEGKDSERDAFTRAAAAMPKGVGHSFQQRMT